MHFNKNPSLLNWSHSSFYSDNIPQESIPIYHVFVKSRDGSVIADVSTTDTFCQLPSMLTLWDIYIASVIYWYIVLSSILDLVILIDLTVPLEDSLDIT